MIDFLAQQGEEERLAGRLGAAAVRLDGHKDGVDLGKLLWVVGTQNPAAIRGAVLVKDSQIERPAFVGALASPNLEGLRARILESRLAIEVEGVKHERLALRVKDAAVGLARAAAAVDIVDIGDIELPRAHQLADIAVGREELLLTPEPALLIA